MPFCDERHVAATTTRKRYGRGKWAATAVVGKCASLWVVCAFSENRRRCRFKKKSCACDVSAAYPKVSVPEVGYLSGALVAVLASFFFLLLVIGSDINGHLLSSSINFVKVVVKRFCVVWILTGGP